ncbi:MAG: CHAT domain-containing protein [Nodosilinea sp.]
MRPLLPAVLLWATLAAPAALAQAILPAADGTGTLVLPDGSTYTITGGTRSGDGANLFHSFEQFGLTAGQVANFLADPAVQNILGRVTGGEASVINGLLQVSGSSASLYLLNPAGILFGPGAALNLDGSFTATTASGLGFGETWLEVMGDSDYTALVGNPTAFGFSGAAGALVNAGNLAVETGKTLTLVSGAVINVGTLSAPGGQIIVMAVPGENLVSIRPAGALLSLELATASGDVQATAPLPWSPLDLPALLRAGEPTVATGIAVQADGTVSLTGSNQPLPTTPGTALVSGSVDVTGETGGTVHLLGERVGVIGGQVEANGRTTGGTVRVGGNYRGEGPLPNAARTLVDGDSVLAASALETGNGGEVSVWASEATQFEGAIFAQGGAAAGDGGLVEVSGQNTLGFNGAVDVSAPYGTWGTLLLDPTNITIDFLPPSSPGVNASLPDIFAAELSGDVVINSTVLENQAGNVVLEATNNITVAPGVSLTFVPGGSITFTADADNDLIGSFAMDASQTLSALGDATTSGRAVTISGAGVTVGAINTSGSTTSGGDIQLASSGSLDTGALTSSSDMGMAGDIDLNANGVLTASGSIEAGTTLDTGGAVNLFNPSGVITVADVLGHSVRLTSFAPLTISTGNLSADTFISVASAGGDITAGAVSTGTGNITLFTDGGTLTAGAITAASGSIALTGDEINLTGGAASVQAPGVITIESATASQPILLGGAMDTGPGSLDLDTVDLAALAEGFSAITIGRADDNGDITLAGTITFSDPTTLTTLGSIEGGTLNGIDNASLTLLAANGISAPAITTAGTPVVVDGGGNGPVVLTAAPISTAGGDVTITSTGDFGGVFIDGASPINSGGGAVTIAGNTAGAFDGVAAVSLSGAIDSQGGPVTVTAVNGNDPGLEVSGPISAGGGDIVLSGTSLAPAGTFATGAALQGPVTSAGGNINVTGQGADGGLVTGGGGSLDSGLGNLTLAVDNPAIQAPVTGSGVLQIQPVDPALDITLGGTGDPFITFLNQDELNQLGNGFSRRTIGSLGSTGALTLAPFNLSSPLVVNGGVITGPDQDTSWQINADNTLGLLGFGAALSFATPIQIVGGSATDTVVGTAGNDLFTVLGLNAATIAGLSFTNIELFDGGAGTDTVAGTSGSDSFSLTSNTSGTVQGMTFANVEALASGGGDDTILLPPGLPLELAVTGGSGSLTVQGAESVVLNTTLTTPGDLTLVAGEGEIAQTGGRVAVAGTTVLDALGNIALGGNNDFSTVAVTGGQSVVLNDINGIQLSDLTFSGGLQVTTGGNLSAIGDITAGGAGGGGVSLTSPSGSITTANITTSGAPITLTAGSTLSTGALDSHGSNGGTVRLQAGDAIRVSSINAQGDDNGGSITALTASTFRAIGSFIDQSGLAASLSTLGGRRGGPIAIGYGASTFTLGDPTVNGTLGAITSGSVTLGPDPSNPIIGSRIFGRGQPGEVQLIAFGDIPIEIEDPPDPDLNELADDLADEVSLISAGQVLPDEALAIAEATLAEEFSGYFGDLIKPSEPATLAQAKATLGSIQAQTGEVPAFLYVRFNRDVNDLKPGQGALELLLITADQDPIQVRVLNVTAEDVIKTQELLRRQITNPSLTDNTAYLATAQQLYAWIVAPLQADLDTAGVTNIGFILDAGLRTLPLAALHDGERFLIEAYSIGLIPSVGLIDATYVDLNRPSSSLVVGGASQFINQPPLLAAGVEMSAIQAFWPGTKVAETNFTVAGLQRSRQQAQIIHLATHAQFLRGAPDNSYLQFFDSRLHLSQVPDLGWFDPQVELVTLSACQTAMGNVEAELGFAGFALLAGAKSALASLWKVSDEATAGLMISFYQQLDPQPIKAEALRQAQLAMIRGEVYTESGQLIWPSGTLSLPPDLAVDGRQDLSHPFYWAAFTMVGSPW